MKQILLAALLLLFAASAATASVPAVSWFTDDFSSYDPGIYGIGLISCAPNWQAAPEGGSNSMLRVQYYTNYNEWPDYTGEGKFVEFKGDSHLGNDSHCQTVANFSSQSSGKLQIFHTMARRGTMQYYTPFPGRYRWYHASFNIRDSSNNDIACWAAGSCGVKAHLTTAPINYPTWDNHYYGMLPMGWAGGPTPVDTTTGVEWLFPDPCWHDFDITYDPATGITNWFADGVLIWTQTQATGRAMNKIWVRDVCVKPDSWTWEDHVSTDQMSIGTTTTPTVVAPAGGTTVNTVRPTVAWNNSAPADPMVAYQVKVTSSDNPNGTTVYDSGTVSGSTTIYNIPSDLSTGAQRWAFVKEQHAIAGWSVWSPTGNGGFYINTGLPGPQPVTNFTATAASAQVSLSWTNPGSDFTGTKVMFKTTGYPTSATDGTQVYDGAGTSTTHTGLTNGLTYYYCAFAHNATPSYAAARYAKATPLAADTTAPGAVTGFKAIKVLSKIELVWRNPYEPDTAGCMIRYKTSGYPTSPTDGTLLVNTSSSRNYDGYYEHTGVTPGQLYYYTAFAYDAALNYSVGAQAISASPGLRVHPENRHYFQDAVTGKPVMITAFTAIVPTDVTFDYPADIAEMHGRRIGYARVWHFLPWAHDNAIWPWGRSSVPNAPMGGNKIDMNTWNATYWTRMKDSLSLANTGGTMASIHLFDRCGLSPEGYDRYQGNPWAWDNNVNNLETPDASLDGTPDFYYWDTKPNLCAQQEKYVRKMIDETIQYPNVMYEVENEHWEWENPWFGWHFSDYAANYIQSTYPDKPRLVSYNSIADDDLETFYSIDSCNIVNHHWGNSVEEDPTLLNDYIEPRWDYNKAINVDEFANGLGDYDVMAEMCWTIVTSGGNFHIEDAEPNISFDVVENIRSFRAQTGWDFIHAAPNKGLITSGGGYCMAQPGVEYVCFFPTGGSKTITLTAATYTARWWNPRTGGFSNKSTFSHGGGGKSLSAPDSNAWALHITSQSLATSLLQSRTAGSLTIDGSSSDWNLAQFTTKICAGDSGTGDIGVVGYDGVVCYQGGHATGLQFPPANAADNAVKIYSRHDSNYLYFLIRCDDNDMRYSNPTSANWANDCVEFYIDPSNDGGSSAMSSSTSDAQLVIDANNQKNVYSTTSGYATQILSGVTSAVVRDGTGWWLEARIAKTAFDPDIPASTGTIGLDFNIRDNDNNNDSALTTTYTWRDAVVGSSPSKVPDRFGDMELLGTSDTTPPGAVTSFTATAGVGQVSLSWHNPSDSDFTGTMIRYKTSGYPTSASDGTLVCDRSASPGSNDGFTHTGLAGGVTCYYSAFSHDGVPNYGTKADANATPTNDTTPPANVAGFTATAGTQQVVLAWTNPSDADFAGTMVRFKTTGYPTSTTDGTLLVDSAGTPGGADGYTHTGLTGGTTYYYKAFAHDGIPNYASGATASAVPTNPTVTTINVKSAANLNLVIDGSSSDWVIGDFTTKVRGGEQVTGDYGIVGFDGGTCYYGGYCTSFVLPTSATDHTAKIYSRHDQQYQYFLIRCDDDQMNYAQPVGTNWANDCVEFYIDPGHDHGSLSISDSSSDLQLVIDCNNQKNVYMTTSGYASQVLAGLTSAVVRDASGWWLEVKLLKSAVDPDLPASGLFGVDFALRDNDNPDATNYAGNPANSTMYSWRDNPSGGSFPTKVPDVWGNAALATLAADTTAPAPVTNFQAISGNQQVSLSWINPATADWAGTMVRFKTTGYPTSATDGTLVYSGTQASYVHGSLTNGTTYYYSAFAFDEVPNYSTKVDAGATPTGAAISTINVKTAANLNLVIDGSSSDWVLGDFTTKSLGGQNSQGDIAIVGYDGGSLYYGGYYNVWPLPTSATDHTAKVYSRHDHQYHYFLLRCDDNDMQYGNPTSANWANDCIEFYIDPGHNHGATGISSSTSDLQLVIDANNQKNVYMTTSGYATQVLGGVTSAVVRDGTGWWLEVKITKTAIDPDLPASGSFGVDFNFRDNDNNNDSALSTCYDWRDNTVGSGFPSKIPDKWGDASVPGLAADTTPPASVTAFTATPTTGQNALAWTNPATSDWAGTMVRFSTTAYPTGPTDGTQCYSGTGASYVHTGLTGGVTYYYCAYAYDEVPNYATAAQASGAPPAGPIVISNSQFNSSADGWTITTWKAHPTLYQPGTMAWASSGGNSGGCMVSTGSGTTEGDSRCIREGGMINKTISTAGHSGIKVYYDLKVNTLGQNYTGYGSATCVVDHDLIDEQITVFYSTNGGSTWVDAGYITRATLLASYQSYGTRTVDLTGVSACDNNASFAVRLRWQFNTASDTGWLDNVKVEANN